MKVKIIILTTLILGLTLLSCDREDVTGDPMDSNLPLSDCWTEIEEDGVLQFSGSNHIFCFVTDTEFTLEQERWTDIISDINAPTRWTDYIKGTYVLTNESFEVKGNYMDSDFVNLGTSQFGETEFAKTFEVKVVSETEMILDNNDIAPYLGIRLVK